jgi:hypothetical protein
MALVCSKLFGSSHNCHFTTISYKYSTFTWSNEYETISTVINVDIGCDIEDKQETILTILYVKLLLFNRVYLFHLEGTLLINISIVIRVIFLLHSLTL